MLLAEPVFRVSRGHLSGDLCNQQRPLEFEDNKSDFQAQSTVDLPIGGHVNVLSDYKETTL